MWRSFFRDKKWFYWSYGGGFFIISLLVMQTYLDVLFNSWYKDFYDILQTADKREISQFWESIKRFLFIALPNALLSLPVLPSNPVNAPPNIPAEAM